MTPAALVTGGGKRVGQAIAVALARAGYDVAIHFSTSAQGAEATRREVEAAGRRAVLVPGDLADRAAVGGIVPRAIESFPDLSVLVNSAGIFRPARLADTDDALFDDHIAVNLRAPFFLTRDFARLLRAPEGAVVNVIDTKAAQEVSGFLAYSVSKKALAAFTRLAARDLGPRIRVNAVCPGDVLPPPGGDASFLERRAAAIPLRTQGRPEYVAEAVVALLAQRFTTGQFLYVDGGEHLLVGAATGEA